MKKTIIYLLGILILTLGYFINTERIFVDYFRENPLVTFSYKQKNKNIKKIQDKILEKKPNLNLKKVQLYGCVRNDTTTDCWGIWQDEKGVFYNIFSRWYMSILYVGLEDIVIKKIGTELPNDTLGNSLLTKCVSSNTEYQIIYGSGINWVKKYIETLGR